MSKYNLFSDASEVCVTVLCQVFNRKIGPLGILLDLGSMSFLQGINIDSNSLLLDIEFFIAFDIVTVDKEGGKERLSWSHKLKNRIEV